MASSRARAMTISDLDNMMENKQQLVGKQFIQPASRGTRGVLGDIRNKARNASVATDQPSKDLKAAKPKLKKIQQNENMVEGQWKAKDEKKKMEALRDKVEEMDVSGVNLVLPEIEDIDKVDGFTFI